MNFDTLIHADFSSVISDAFIFWLTLTLKASVITGVLLAIVHIRNRWRPDQSLAYLWKSGIVTLAFLPLLAFTPGLQWSVDFLDSAMSSNQPAWKVWVNSGINEQNAESVGEIPKGLSSSELAVSQGVEFQNTSIENSSAQSPSILFTFFIGIQFLTVSCWITFVMVIAARKSWELSIGTGRWVCSLQCNAAPEDWKLDLTKMLKRLNVKQKVDLLTSSQIISPVALGIRRARIILPEAAESWSSEERQSAMAHELSHIRNRDLEFQWVTAATQSCFWFLPWVHRLVQWLTLDQERDGDQIALANGAEKDAYLVFLTNVAARVRSNTNFESTEVGNLQLSRVGLQMASGNESSLKRRVQSIARFDSNRSPWFRFLAFPAAFSILAAGAGLGSAHLVSSKKEIELNSIISTSEITKSDAPYGVPLVSNPESQQTNQTGANQIPLEEDQTQLPVKKNEKPVLISRVYRIAGEDSALQQMATSLSKLEIQPPSMISFKESAGMLEILGTSPELRMVWLELMNHQISIELMNEDVSSLPALNWHTRVFKVENPEVIASIRQNSQEWLDSFIRELKESSANIHPDTRLFVTENNPEQILIKARKQDMDWITEALTLKVGLKAQIHAKFTILEMDESVAKEFVQLWTDGEQIRSVIEYHVRESSGLTEALANSITNTRIDEGRDDALNPGTEKSSADSPPKTDESPKLQMILPDTKYREAMQWVKSQPIDILSAPQVTTLSERQAQIQVSQEISVVNGVETSEGKTNYTTQQIPYGLSIDMIPTVDHPGERENHKPSVGMSLVVQFSEFLGYDDPKDLDKSRDSNNKQDQKPMIPLPRSRKRTLSTEVNIPDGSALLIGSIPTLNTLSMKSKVPMLGDIPYVGKLFRKEQTQEVRKLRFIIVQPSIVDDKGAHLNPGG